MADVNAGSPANSVPANYKFEQSVLHGGRGGIEDVCAATDRRTGGQVTLLFFDEELCQQAQLQALLVEELARLEELHQCRARDSSGALEIFESGRHQGRLFVALERVAAVPLTAHLQHSGPLPADLALAWLQRITTVLCAHLACGLPFFGDLQPERLLLPTSVDLRAPPGAEAVLLLDVGLGRATARYQERRLERRGAQSRAVLHGAPEYLAPEQCQGQGPCSERTDSYALGILLYQLLLGHPPFQDQNPLRVLLQHGEQAPDLTDPCLTDPVVALLKKLLAKEPAQRPIPNELLTLLPEVAIALRSPPGRVAQAPRLGPYLVGELLGEGGMARVYAATHSETGAACAVKVLNELCRRHEALVQRFLVEVAAVRKVQHSGVVAILDAGTASDGTPYLVMERLAGQTLARRLGHGSLPVDTALNIAAQMGAAVAVAHARAIVHRDLKPENTMLLGEDAAPQVKILDFGIAKVADEYQLTRARRLLLTCPGEVLGTLEYMAPEQRRSAAAVTGKADVYALGVMLYEMLTGRTPFSADGVLVQMQQDHHVAAIPLRRRAPELPRPLTRLVDHMMAINPQERPAMAEVVDELQRLRTRGSHDQPAPRWRSMVVSILALAVVVGVLLGVVVTTKLRRAQARSALLDQAEQALAADRFPSAREMLQQLLALSPDAALRARMTTLSERLTCEESAAADWRCFQEQERAPAGSTAAEEGLSCFEHIPKCSQRARDGHTRYLAIRQRWQEALVVAAHDQQAAGKCPAFAALVERLRSRAPAAAAALARAGCSPPAPPPMESEVRPAEVADAPLRTLPRPVPAWRQAIQRAWTALNERKPELAWSVISEGVTRGDLSNDGPGWERAWYLAGIAGCREKSVKRSTIAYQRLVDSKATDMKLKLLNECQTHGLVYENQRGSFVLQ